MTTTHPNVPRPAVHATTGVPAPALVAARLDTLILIRIATLKKPASRTELARATRALAPATHDDARWAAAVDDAIERLRAAGAIDAQLRPSDGAPSAARRLGISGPFDWKRVTERIVPAMGLGIEANDAKGHGRLKDSGAWAAAIVARRHGLWQAGPPPSSSATCDALVWRALQLAGTPKRTPPEIRAHFLAQALAAASAPPDKLLRLLAAREVGATRTDLRGLREALARRWLSGQELGAARTTEPAPAARTSTTPSLAAFAATVRDTIARQTDGAFGTRKVFIAAAWRALRDHASLGASSLDDFKQQLIAAHKAGLLTLVRADLVAAMDPSDVRDSETVHLEARYHFIEREPT